MGVERLAGSLTRLHDALVDLRLPIDLPDAEGHRTLAQTQAHQIQDYVVPRLRRLDAPLLAVVGGSTGAGKSTLVNSLIGRAVSESGVIRPTTRSSVLIHHPSDEHWFASGQILPGLARSDSPGADPRVLQLVPEPGLPEGLAILDAPDVDSVVAENRTLAAQLLAAADLWLFVTSAARYADAVPWQYLRDAATRRAVVAVVLDRVPPLAMSEVPTHLGQMMSQRGLATSPLFAVPEVHLSDSGMLPDASVAPIRSWLNGLALDVTRRNEVVLQTLDGAIESLAGQGGVLVQAAAEQVAALETLRADAEKAFAEATRAISAQTADGTLLRGEVLARWQDFVGTGEFFRSVEKRIGLFRDRVGQVVRGEPKQAQEVKLAVESGLEVLITEEGEAASRRAVSAWEAHPAGRQILARDETLGRLSSGFAEAAPRVIREWQGDVLELVSTEGQAKKATARYLALGVNGAGVALMILVFSQTGGLAGAEVGIAGGTAVLAQRVLEAVFGDDAVRRLSKQAKQQLDDRVQALMAMELVRFEQVLDEFDVAEIHGERLSAALAGLDTERVDPDRYQHPSESAPVFSPEAVAGAAEQAAAGPGGGLMTPEAGAVNLEAIPDSVWREPAPMAPEAESAEAPESAEIPDPAEAPESAELPKPAESPDPAEDPEPAELPESAEAAPAPVEDSAVGDLNSAGEDAVAEPVEPQPASAAEGDAAESDHDGEANVESGRESGDDPAQTADTTLDEVAQADAADPAVEVTAPAELPRPQQQSQPQPRPIPVPAELAELAAEAVRRPDAANPDAGDPDAQDPESGTEAGPDAAHEAGSDSASDAGETEPVPPQFRLPAPPPLTSPPMPAPAAESDASESGPAESNPADSNPASVPNPLSLPTPPRGLIPPLQTPPPPEVPAWPNAEPPMPTDSVRQE